MVTATFQKTTDDPRTIGKKITYVKDVSCKIYEPSSVTDPTLILDYDAELFAGSNYVTIGAPFNRSYFLSPFVTAKGGKMTVTAHVDVLQTFKDGIRNLKPIVSRRDGEYDSMIQDEFQTVRAACDKEIAIFEQPVMNDSENLGWNYVIEIIGSEPETQST